MSRTLPPAASLDAAEAEIRATRHRLGKLLARAEQVGPPSGFQLVDRALRRTAASVPGQPNARFLAAALSLGMVGLALAVATRDARRHRQPLRREPAGDDE